MKVDMVSKGTPTRLVDLNGTVACIGDIIEYATTEGRVVDGMEIKWDETNLCVCIGSFPYYRLMESAFIQSATPGKRDLDFEIKIRYNK